MSLIRKHVAVLQAWACLALVSYANIVTQRFRLNASQTKI